MIEADAIVTRTEGLMSTPVDDEIVFLNPGTDSYVALDWIGRRIWEMLESPQITAAPLGPMSAAA